jgi:hypothetical protein
LARPASILHDDPVVRVDRRESVPMRRPMDAAPTFEIPHLRVMARHAVPHLVEATFVPLATAITVRTVSSIAPMARMPGMRLPVRTRRRRAP